MDRLESMASSDPYPTLSGRGEAETRVKASRFLAVAAPAGSEEEARALLAERQRMDFDATHHCSAWRLHDGVWRANDAGEPSGSAGAPILAAIDGARLEDCAVVVTRYYGGTKLGVGGLIRAYGDAAALALRSAPRRLATPAARMRVRYDYAHTAAVMRVMERLGAQEVEHGFTAGGAGGEVEFTVPLSQHAILPDLLREQTAGAVSAETLATRLIYSPL
jgi:uncharacterized YigZ family protein